jgi:hypothetical protein
MTRDEKVMAEQLATEMTTAALDQALAHQIETQNGLGAAIIASALVHKLKTLAVSVSPFVATHEVAYGRTVALSFPVKVF